jgi:hypothetical protein
LPAVNTDEGVRAVTKSVPIAPDAVERYLESKFGEALPEARKVLMELANALVAHQSVWVGSIFSLGHAWGGKGD